MVHEHMNDDARQAACLHQAVHTAVSTTVHCIAG